MKNDFPPTVGHHFNLQGEWGGVLDCQVLAIEPPKTLFYTWNHTNNDPAFSLNSVVTFSSRPHELVRICAWSKRGSAPISIKPMAGPCMVDRSSSKILSRLLRNSANDRLVKKRKLASASAKRVARGAEYPAHNLGDFHDLVRVLNFERIYEPREAAYGSETHRAEYWSFRDWCR